MLINNNVKTNFGYAKMVKSFEHAGVELAGKNALPKVVSKADYQYCIPFWPEMPMNNMLRIKTVLGKANANHEVGTKCNHVFKFQNREQAMQAYKEISEGNNLDAAVAFAKYLDDSLSGTGAKSGIEFFG